MVALFAIIAVGLLVGSVSIKGINLGSSGVLFAALLAGHLGYSIPDGVGTLGLVLFVYCVGIGAGGRFFASVAREGATLAKLALIIVTTGGLITWAGASLLGLPADLATGIFAGALTSTPALAAATEGLKESGSGVSIGYGIAYPMGVIGVVLFVQLLPRLLKHDLEKLAAELRRRGRPRGGLGGLRRRRFGDRLAAEHETRAPQRPKGGRRRQHRRQGGAHN